MDLVIKCLKISFVPEFVNKVLVMIDDSDHFRPGRQNIFSLAGLMGIF